VQINDKRSTTLPIERGVIQGSCLSPLLYSIYCNDLCNFNDESVKITLFADDTCLLIKNKSLQHLHNKAQSIINDVYMWFTNNKLCVNPQKSNVLLFTKDKNAQNFCININQSIIGQKSETKYLGITLQSNLKWNCTVNEKIKKMIKFRHIFKHIRNFMSEKRLIILYKSLVVSNLIYGIELFGNCQKYLIKRLQLVQNNFLRIIQRKNIRFHVQDLHSKVDLLTIENLIKFRQAMLIFDMIKMNNSNEFYQITLHKEHHRYNTRSRNVSLEKYSTFDQKKIKSSCAVIYNSLPQDIKIIKDRAMFKTAVYDYLLKNNFIN